MQSSAPILRGTTPVQPTKALQPAAKPAVASPPVTPPDATRNDKGGMRVKLPVKEWATESLGEFYPHLTAEQITAITTGAPVPPSHNWAGLANLPAVVDGPPQAIEAGEAERLALVSCILIFGVPERVKMARHAVNQFVQQVYPAKQLVIINTTDVAVTNIPHPQIKEVRRKPEEPLSLGEMRNLGLDHARGSWIVPAWDDDDFYHPYFLLYLMAHRVPGKATLLANQIRVDIENATGYMHSEDAGIPGTMLIPALKDRRFEHVNGGEVSSFWGEHYGLDTIVAPNHLFPFNSLLTAVFHKHNVKSVDDFMGVYAGTDYHHKLMLNEKERDYIIAEFKTTGLNAETEDPRAAEAVS